MKILDLILCHKWFDMTADGIKQEEYRETTTFWCSRICRFGRAKRGDRKKKFCNIDCKAQTELCKIKVPTDITHVRLHRAYTNDTMIIKVATIRRGIGKPEWGAPNHETFIIKYAEQ